MEQSCPWSTAVPPGLGGLLGTGSSNVSGISTTITTSRVPTAVTTITLADMNTLNRNRKTSRNGVMESSIRKPNRNWNNAVATKEKQHSVGSSGSLVVGADGSNGANSSPAIRASRRPPTRTSTQSRPRPLQLTDGERGSCALIAKSHDPWDGYTNRPALIPT